MNKICLLFAFLPLVAHAETHFDTLLKAYKTAQPVKPRELVGAWTGRCYYMRKGEMKGVGPTAGPNDAIGSLLYGEVAETEGDDGGPKFPAKTTVAAAVYTVGAAEAGDALDGHFRFDDWSLDQAAAAAAASPTVVYETYVDKGDSIIVEDTHDGGTTLFGLVRKRGSTFYVLLGAKESFTGQLTTDDPAACYFFKQLR